MNALHSSYHQAPSTPGGTSMKYNGNGAFHKQSLSNGTNNYQINKQSYHNTAAGPAKVRQPNNMAVNNNMKKYSKNNLNRGESTGNSGN